MAIQLISIPATYHKFINNVNYEELEDTVKKDDICTFKDNYVSIMDKEEFEEGSGIIPSVQFSLNLDNVKVVETLS